MLHDTDWLGELAPLTTAAHVAVDPIVIVDGMQATVTAVTVETGAVSVSVTGTTRGELFTVCPDELGAVSRTVMPPFIVPDESPVVLTHADEESFVLPDPGVTVNHAAPDETDMGSGPAALSSIVSGWQAIEDPTWPEKDSDDGAVDIVKLLVGGGAAALITIE